MKVTFAEYAAKAGEILNGILDGLETAGKWDMPWIQSMAEADHNAISGHRFTGWWNPMATAMKRHENGWTDTRWLTLGQAAKSKGAWWIEKGEIRNGLTLIIPVFQSVPSPDDPEKRIQKLVGFSTYEVYNACQCKVAPPRPEAEKGGEFEPIAAMEVTCASFSVPAPKFGGDSAFYRPDTDEIHLPDREAFTSSEGLYSTWAHEAAHATGHASRLNRPGISSPNFGSDKYAEEELVAEFTAAIVMGSAGLTRSLPNSAAYVKGWRDRISDRQISTTRALSAAIAAAHYLLNPA